MKPIVLVIVALLSFDSVAAAELRRPTNPNSAGPSARIVEDPTPCRQRQSEEVVRLDFDGSTVRDLSRTVGRLLCENFVLDPNVVNVRVFVSSNAEIRMDALWPTFLHILRVNDLTVVDHFGQHAIVMAADGARESVPTYGIDEEVPRADRMVTKVVRVRGHDLNAVANFLNIFKTGKGQIHPFADAGILVMTDFASSIARLEWLLGQLPRSAAAHPRRR